MDVVHYTMQVTNLLKNSPKMSPLPAHQQLHTESSEQITGDHPSTSELPPRPYNIPRHSTSSSLPVKSALMSLSRSNSIASRRQSSRAGSRQAELVRGQVGPDMGAFRGDFDFNNWNLEVTGFDDFVLDPEAVGLMDSFLADHPNIWQADLLHNGLQPVRPSVPFEGAAVQQDYFDPYLGTQQQQQSYEPQFDALGAIDPALLIPSSQYEPQYMQPIELQATPGLTALPGVTDDFLSSQIGAHAQQIYPGQGMQPLYAYEDPLAIHGPQAYYARPGYVQNFQQFDVQQPVYANTVSLQHTTKRRRSDSVSDLDAPSTKRLRATVPAQQHPEPEFDSGSESDGDLFTHPTHGRKDTLVRRGSRGSGVSSSSSLGKQPFMKVVKRSGEKPQKDKKKTWVRVNTATRGETTRTGRINEEAETERPYKHQPLPHGDWQTLNGKYRFEYKYDEAAQLDEFKADFMSPRKLMAYITKYPSEHLKLWIQVNPSDSARRYGSQEHSRCLFSECPARLYNKHGNILPGHYRVAFDEKFVAVQEHEKIPNKVLDPYDCTGFVHLTCLERFCDFEAICRKANVQVDERTIGKGCLPWETGKARFSMAQRPETALAQYFVKACRKDKLRETEHFKDYPVHVTSCEPKAYEHTLTKALNDIAAANRTRSQKRQFVNRNLGPGQLVVNHGDLEIAFLDEKIKASDAFKKHCSIKKLKPNEADLMPFYENFQKGIVNQRIAECLALQKKFKEEDDAGIVRTKGKAEAAPRVTKRKVVTIEDSDSEPDLDDHRDAPSHLDDFQDHHQPGPKAESPRGTRSSPRKRQRVDYSVDDQQHPLPPLPLLSPTPPPMALPTQEPQPYADQGYQAAQQPRQDSFSHLFAQNGNTYDIDNRQSGADDDYVPFRRDSAEYAVMMKGLLRRKSSTLSTGPVDANQLQRRKSSAPSYESHYGGIMNSSQRSPSMRSPRKSSAGRQASFALQPISESKEFHIDDPPNQVASTPTRRSARLASRGS
jgi:hypothetical protein